MWFGVMERQRAVLKGVRWFPDVWGALTFARNTIKAGSYGFFRLPFLPFDPAVPPSPATDYGAKLAIWVEDSRVQMGPIGGRQSPPPDVRLHHNVNLLWDGCLFPVWFVQLASFSLSVCSTKMEISHICFIVLCHRCERDSFSLHVSHIMTLSSHAHFLLPVFPR